jgi:hypothetical protein
MITKVWASLIDFHLTKTIKEENKKWRKRHELKINV